MNRNLKDYILLILRGVGMGAADVVPGVSGGTIALITGIYDELINSIKNIPSAVRNLFKNRFDLRLFWKELNGNFLVALLLGIAISFLSLAKIITYLLEHQPVSVWAFFSGLILASTVFIARDVKWNFKTVAAFVIFAAASFLITAPENSPLQSAPEYWYIFLCGSIAICAMILPGISGSFILVLLGQYFFMMKALAGLNVVPILIFLTGAVIGILLFSNILSWLLEHFKNLTLASLMGFMFGSLNKIWPWKQTLDTFIDAHGTEQPLTQKNLLPLDYRETVADPQIVRVILVAIAGFLLIFVIELIAKRLNHGSDK